MRLLISSILIAVSIAAFTYSVREYRTHEPDIAIQLSDFFDRIALPHRIIKLTTEERDTELLMPIRGLRSQDVADTWGEARAEGRTHEGVDIFAARGTPVFSATEGYVVRSGVNILGGNYVFVIGRGGVRYYYAHLDSIVQGMEPGQKVTTDTVLGFVGNTGNASGTPPHLHFGMYHNGAENPYDLLVFR